MITAQFLNLDFLTVGIAVASNLILGFIIFFQNPRSATSILFILQTIILSTWSVMNYLTYVITDLDLALIFERLVMFFAIPNSVIFMLLMHTFPDSRLRIRKKTLLVLVAISLAAMGVAISPFLFTRVEVVPGVVTPQPVVGPGMAAFIPTAILTIFAGLYFLIKRYKKSSGVEKLQLRFLLLGVMVMFALILVLDFIFPAILDNTRFIPLSAVFTLPFVAFTAYAIFKHHLLNVKVIATEILTFVLAVAMLFEVILSKDPATLVLRSGVFALVLGLGILLIRSVLKEVEQREQLQVLTEKLKAANTELESLSRFKTQLLSLASHQVKSPLAAIKGFATLLIEGSYGAISDKVKETVEKMKRASDNLINLINNLLDLRKVEEGKMEYTFAKVGIRELVTSIVEELQPLAKAKNLKFTFAPGPEFAVNADALKLRQVIHNLIDNAIKYTPSGFVSVKIKDLGDSIAISVIDSGVGIPKELLPHLFEEFIRDERIKKDILGTGLGLYIARKMIEAHGGTIGAESEGPGRGSKFYIKLKKA